MLVHCHIHIGVHVRQITLRELYFLLGIAKESIQWRPRILLPDFIYIAIQVRAAIHLTLLALTRLHPESHFAHRDVKALITFSILFLFGGTIEKVHLLHVG